MPIKLATDERHRNYCFTINNYTTEELESLGKLKCKYMIYGKEVGENGTPHLQGFIIWKDAKSFTATKKSLGERAHIEVCAGTPYENFKYCSKSGIYTESGDRPQPSGKRNDLENIKNQVENNVKIKSMLRDNTIRNFQQLKYAEGLKKYYEKQRTEETIVWWFYGSTGTGKTHNAFQRMLDMGYEHDDIYMSMDTAEWWEGYDQHPVVIIDDMRKDFIKFHTLLKLLDKYPYRVQTKGSSRQFVAKYVIITSPFRPEELYSTREDIKQLTRRIKLVEHFDKEYIIN